MGSDPGSDIPRDFWREVPCGHPQDPVAAWAGGHPVCHCGRILDVAEALPLDYASAPGPIVPCSKCGCAVAIPDEPEPVVPAGGLVAELEAEREKGPNRAGKEPKGTEKGAERSAVPTATVTEARANVEKAAREVDAMLAESGPPFRFDGVLITDAAESALLSLHDYLNDVDRALAELPTTPGGPS